ncbi:GNAT family N-acetyltransferase [Saccharothrix carnea]|nr:GNAT family N-acetyltransferase [Saccharothrix carnea]
MDAREMARIYNFHVRLGGRTLDTVELPDEYFLEILADDKQTVIVAADGHNMVGWGRLFPWSKKFGYRQTAETSIYVDVSSYRSRIGSRIKSALIENARSQGLHALIARVISSNTGGMEINKAFGYRLVGIQREVGIVGLHYVDVAIFELLL